MEFFRQKREVVYKKAVDAKKFACIIALCEQILYLCDEDDLILMDWLIRHCTNPRAILPTKRIDREQGEYTGFDSERKKDKKLETMIVRSGIPPIWMQEAFATQQIAMPGTYITIYVAKMYRLYMFFKTMTTVYKDHAEFQFRVHGTPINLNLCHADYLSVVTIAGEMSIFFNTVIHGHDENITFVYPNSETSIVSADHFKDMEEVIRSFAVDKVPARRMLSLAKDAGFNLPLPQETVDYLHSDPNKFEMYTLLSLLHQAQMRIQTSPTAPFMPYTLPVQAEKPAMKKSGKAIPSEELKHSEPMPCVVSERARYSTIVQAPREKVKVEEKRVEEIKTKKCEICDKELDFSLFSKIQREMKNGTCMKCNKW